LLSILRETNQGGTRSRS